MIGMVDYQYQPEVNDPLSELRQAMENGDGTSISMHFERLPNNVSENASRKNMFLYYSSGKGRLSCANWGTGFFNANGPGLCYEHRPSVNGGEHSRRAADAQEQFEVVPPAAFQSPDYYPRIQVSCFTQKKFSRLVADDFFNGKLQSKSRFDGLDNRRRRDWRRKETID